MKQRSIPVCIILSLITCGIYSWYWMVVMTDDVNRLSGRQRPSGGTALLLTIVTCGIYSIYWAYQMGDALYAAKVQRGIPASNNNVLYLILEIVFALIGWCLIQDEINKLVVTTGNGPYMNGPYGG